MKARIRSIKPESLLDEKLWDGEQETGLPLFRAFCGLWCHADRSGRFEWRARPLKAGILPYWEGDFARVLEALAERGFLVRYTVAGREYGLVRTFAKHQVVNQREAQSTLPGPAEAETGTEAQSICTHVQDSHADHTQSMCMHVGKGRERGTEGNGKEQELQVISRKAAASPVPSTIARATEPQPQQSPEKWQEGSPIPEKTPSIQSRAAEKLRDPTSANWDRPASWPELVTTADAFAAALGLRMPRLGGMSDAGVRALLELFAAGFTTDELSTAAKAAKTDPWCQNSTAKRGLSSMSPEVVRRLLDVRVRVEAPDAESQKLAEGFA